MNILLISPTTDILKREKGDEVRINSIANQLVYKGHNVICLCPQQKRSLEKNDVRFKIIREFKKCTPTFLADLNLFFYSEVYNILKKENVDLIQVSFPTGIIATKIVLKLLRLRKIIVYDAHNVEGVKVKEVKNPNLPFYKRIIAPLYIPILENIAVKLANKIISVSQVDKELFTKKYNLNPEKITVIPSGAEVINKKSMVERDKTRAMLGIKPTDVVIVFHGSYNYYPNKEAVDLIINFIAPEIKKSFDNVKFAIAGKDVPKFENENIKSVGFVEDIYSLLNACDIAIVPILRGGGTRLKILDYMAVGLPIVTTKKGIEGIEAENMKHAIILDDVNEEFIAAIEYLINNEKVRKKIGANARRLAEEEYDWNKIGEKLDELYKRLLEKK